MKPGDSRRLVVGLTGGIASGKSTVARLFADLGVTVIDADQLAREVVEPGEPALEAVREVFGSGVIAPDGRLDRAAMRNVVFADPAERKRLEGILHPHIRARMAEAIAAAEGPYCIVEIPLLVESGWRDRLDRVLVVDVEPERQVTRAMTRSDLTADEVRAIMRAQASREARLAAADDVIPNHADREALGEQVRGLHEKYLLLAQDRHG